MPKKFQIELHDGRKFEVETDGEPPNEDDVLQSIGHPSVTDAPDHSEADDILRQAHETLDKPPVFGKYEKSSDEITKATADTDESLLRKGWNFATKPLTDAPSRFAKSVSDYINPGSETTGLRGIGSAYIEGLGHAISGLSSPINLATAGLGLAETSAAKLGLPQVARLAGIGGRIAAAPMVPEGLKHAYEGEHWDEKLSGLLEATMGAHGMRGHVAEEIPRIDEGPDIIPPEYNRGPQGDIIDVRSPESNPARLLEGGQRRLGIGDIGDSIRGEPTQPTSPLDPHFIYDEAGNAIAPADINQPRTPDRPAGPWDANVSMREPVGTVDDIRYEAATRNYRLRNLGQQPDIPVRGEGEFNPEFQPTVAAEHGLPAEYATDIPPQEEFPTTRPGLENIGEQIQSPDLMQQFQESQAPAQSYDWPEAGGTFSKNAEGSDVLSPDVFDRAKNAQVNDKITRGMDNLTDEDINYLDSFDEFGNRLSKADKGIEPLQSEEEFQADYNTEKERLANLRNTQRESLFSGETGAVGDVRGAREARESKLFKMNNPTPEKVRTVQEKGYTLDPKNPLNDDGSFNFVKGSGGGGKPPKGPILESDVADIEPPKKPKVKDNPSLLRQLAELPRELMSVDLPFTTSAAFRQASPWIGTRNWFKAWVPSVKAYGSKAVYEKIQNRIENDPLVRPNAKGQSFLTDIMGVKLTDLDSINSREEFFRSELAEKIPVYGKFIGGSARAYTSFLNDLRLNQSRTLIRDAQAMGVDPFKDLVFAKQLGEFINTTTGRGTLKTSIGIGKKYQKTIDLEHNAKLLSDVLFSPRLMASRINMLNPQTYLMAPPMIRQQYAFAMMRSVGAWMTIAGLAKLAGAQVSMSPTSADFGKIKIGNTRLDPGQGFQQYLVLGARNIEGGNTGSTDNRWKPYGKGYKPETRGSTIQDFLANKMEPKLKLAYDLFFANKSRPVYIGDRLLQMAAPMLASDIKSLVDDDPGLGLLFGIPAAATVGFGTQTYDRKSNFQDPALVPKKLQKYDFKFTGVPLGR